MFCMVFLLCLVRGTIPSTRPGPKPVGRRLHGWAKGPAGNPRGAGVERAGRFAANTARTGAGLRAGNRTGLGDCQSKGRCLNQAAGRGTQADEFSQPHPAMSGPGGTIPVIGKGLTTPTLVPCPTARAAAIPVEYSARMHTDQNLAPCFNLRRCRSQTCGKGRRAGSGPSPTSKCLRRRVPGTRSRSSPMSRATSSPDWRTSMG